MRVFIFVIVVHVGRADVAASGFRSLWLTEFFHVRVTEIETDADVVEVQRS